MSIQFNFEESELLNNYFEDPKGISQKEAIYKMENILTALKDPELIGVVESTLQKVKSLDTVTFKKIFNDMPIDSYTKY